ARQHGPDDGKNLPISGHADLRTGLKSRVHHPHYTAGPEPRRDFPSPRFPGFLGAFAVFAFGAFGTFTGRGLTSTFRHHSATGQTSRRGPIGLQTCWPCSTISMLMAFQ